MQNHNPCLQEAMFIASESYSGSTYEVSLFETMNEPCDEAVVMVFESDPATASLLAA